MQYWRITLKNFLTITSSNLLTNKISFAIVPVNCSYNHGYSLRSKRFRKQRTIGVLPAQNMGPREKWDENQKNEGHGGREDPSPTPLCVFFFVQPQFLRGKNIENLFLGLSLLPNPTETLATQAIMDNIPGAYLQFWRFCVHARPEYNFTCCIGARIC